MLDEEVKAVLLALMIVGTIFLASHLLWNDRGEAFSELGLLGPEKKLGGYPKVVLVNESFTIYVYVGNHEGRSMYYQLRVKVGDNGTFVNETVPANVAPIATYDLVLPDEGNATIPVNVSISKPGRHRLIVELWTFNGTMNYSGNWVQLWLNVTSP